MRANLVLLSTLPPRKGRSAAVRSVLLYETWSIPIEDVWRLCVPLPMTPKYCLYLVGTWGEQ